MDIEPQPTHSFEEALNARAQPDLAPIVQNPSPEWRRFFRMHPKLKTWLPVIGVSILSSLIVFAAMAGVAWHFRGAIARTLIASVPATPGSAQVATIQTPDGPVTVPIVGAASTATQPHDLSVTDVVAKANPSVVSIEVSQNVTMMDPFAQFFGGSSQSSTQNKVVGGGSGFFVTSDGLVVTNRHVVDFNNATFAVITSSGKRYAATVVAKDPVLDIAMLRVQGSGFTPATLGDSDSLQLGQSVVAIGYALGEFKNSISTGVISGLSRSIVAGGEGTSEQLDKVIQTDAAINPGNSGGPLLNLRGEVIGVDVAMAQGSQNVGFALPINSVRAAIDSVKRTGVISRPYIGVQYAQIDASVQSQLNLPFDYGVLVQQVLPGTPGERAGLRQGDIILSIDGTKLDGDTSFASAIRGKAVGQTVTLQIYSGGITKNIRLMLAQAPAS